MSYYQNAEQNYNIKIADRTIENVAKFRYLEMTKIQNLIHEVIKTDEIRVMLPTIQLRTFYLPIYFLKIQKLKYRNYNFACTSVWV
jgi:hypothetical protein